MKLSYKLSTLSLLLALTGCMVGPDYQRPTQPLPLAFKEAKGWQQAQPQDTLQKGEWWQIYQDPQLDQLSRRSPSLTRMWRCTKPSIGKRWR